MKHWQEIVLGVVMWVAVMPVLLLAALWAIGTTIEDYGSHLESRDRCLKQATNGYEIKQCR